MTREACSELSGKSNTSNSTTSWALEAWNHRIGLSAVRSSDEPNLVSFYLLGKSREDFPCGCCDVDDPSLPESIDLSDRPALKMFVGLWPVTTVKAWCCELLDSLNGDTTKPARFCSPRHSS